MPGEFAGVDPAEARNISSLLQLFEQTLTCLQLAVVIQAVMTTTKPQPEKDHTRGRGSLASQGRTSSQSVGRLQQDSPFSGRHTATKRSTTDQQRPHNPKEATSQKRSLSPPRPRHTQLPRTGRNRPCGCYRPETSLTRYSDNPLKLLPKNSRRGRFRSLTPKRRRTLPRQLQLSHAHLAHRTGNGGPAHKGWMLSPSRRLQAFQNPFRSL